MKNSILAFSAITLTFFSCEKKTETLVTTDNNQDTIVVKTTDSLAPNDDTGLLVDEHNSRNSLDWDGIYHATLPCADCEGIHTIIEINQDETYKLTQEYLNKNLKLEDTGKFSWSADGGKINIKTKENGNFNFIVGEDRLIMLDQEGNEIKGTLAEHYILKKK